MLQTKVYHWFLKIGILMFFVACSNKKHEVVLQDSNILQVPPHISYPASLIITPPNAAQILLGKKLFFDVRLSSDSSISCASCHLPSKSFSDGLATSIGIKQAKGERNAPALINLAWQKDLFWDGGAANLELQILGPLTSDKEMGTNLLVLNKLLNKNVEYKNMFKDAFGTDTVTTQRLGLALAQYERSLMSYNSDYDIYMVGKLKLSMQQQQGKEIFEKKCSSCHTPPLFTDFQYHNNGLDSQFPELEGNMDDPHLGRARITKQIADIGKYKTPTLRNLAFTAPYMHDGRFNSLNEVLNHYSDGIKQSATLSDNLKNTITLTDDEKVDLLKFLEILNDSSYTKIK